MTEGAAASPDSSGSPLDIRRVMAALPHRYPMLLVDRVERIERDRSITAIKAVTINEPFFQGHFPGRPIMPGVLIVEAMAQAGVVLYTLSMHETPEERRQTKFLGQIEARFLRPAFPGDRLVIDLGVVRLLKGAIAVKGVVRVGGQPIVKGEFLLMQARRQTAREGVPDVRAER